MAAVAASPSSQSQSQGESSAEQQRSLLEAYDRSAQWIIASETGGLQNSSNAEDSQSLQRVNSATIMDDFQGAGIAVVFSGFVLGVAHFAMAAALVWYSMQVPKTCSSDLRTMFRLIGSLDGVLGVLLMCTFLAGRYLVDAMGHKVLATKYETESRFDEAEMHKIEASKKFAAAAIQGLLPIVGFVSVQVALSVAWIYGAFQAIRADSSSCGSSVTVFWALFICNSISGCCTCCCKVTIEEIDNEENSAVEMTPQVGASGEARVDAQTP
eukprot:TRINITY_DN9860_c0_g4_i1.p1 TRINITY_DN9860_c0_g4~~TRINITY_DN9860_c0_g4_i1.p1  ORF type:complete len:288 (+),score=40.29 TRINITY_DN9860_c0_g4_i1:60-866(+)